MLTRCWLNDSDYRNRAVAFHGDSFSQHVSVSFRLKQFPWLLISLDLDSLRRVCYCVKCVSTQGLSDSCPHGQPGVAGLGAEEHRGKAPSSSHHVPSLLLAWLVSSMSALITWLRWPFPAAPPHPWHLSVLYSLKSYPWAQPPLKGKEVKLHVPQGACT